MLTYYHPKLKTLKTYAYAHYIVRPTESIKLLPVGRYSIYVY